MNNIYFFHHFNNLLKTYYTNHNNINQLIKDKTVDNYEELTNDELHIINKYNDLHDISQLFLDSICSISNDINQYLKKNCKHEWNTDFIDIDTEHSKQIKYCNYCNSDFFDL